MHTLNPGCAHYAQAARTAPHYGSQWHRIVAKHRPCRRPPRPYRRAHAYSSPQRCIMGHCGRIAAPNCPVSRHMVAPSQPRYNFVSQPSSQWQGPCARAPLALRTSRLYRGPLMIVSWHRLGRVVAEFWPCRGPLAAPRPAFPASVS